MKLDWPASSPRRSTRRKLRRKESCVSSDRSAPVANGGLTPNSRRSSRPGALVRSPASCAGTGVPYAGIKN